MSGAAALAECLRALDAGLRDLGATITRALRAIELAPHPGGSGDGSTLDRAPVARGESTETAAARGGAAPAQVPGKKIDPWTNERLAHLKRAWARGDEPAEILAAVNALPGPVPVGTEVAIRSMASKRRFRRSAEGWRLVVQRRAAKVAPRKWTPEMEVALREDYPNKQRPVEEIAARVTEMAGAVVTPEAVMAQAQKLGILRGRGRVADRPYGGKRRLAKWSDERRALLARIWIQVPRLSESQMAEALNALPGEPITPSQVGVYGASALKLPKRGRPPRVAVSPQAEVRPPALPPRVVPSAPPSASGQPVPETQPAALTNPAGDVAAPEGCASQPPDQSLPAAAGAPPAASHGKPMRQAPPAAEGDPPPYDPASKGSMESRVEQARRMLRERKDPSIVGLHTRLPPREVLRIAGEVRMEQTR